jgi:hypothetical protein
VKVEPKRPVAALNSQCSMCVLGPAKILFRRSPKSPLPVLY